MIEETTRELIKLFQDTILETYPDIFEGLSPDDIQNELAKRVVLSAGSITQFTSLPIVVFHGPVLVHKHRLNRDTERITVIDEEKGRAIREVPPRWYDLRFGLNISCESSIDLLKLIEVFSRLNQGYALLNAKNEERERQYLWKWETPPQISTIPNISQVVQGHADIIVYDVEVYSDIHEVWPLIQKVSGEINSDNIEVQL